jgi:magnesium transporter
MHPAGGASLLQDLSYPDGSAILRLATTGDRQILLEALPHRLRRNFETSLAFPEDTVGAHMTTSILALSPVHTVGDALAEISRLPRLDGDNLYVVDGERRLVGLARIADLLRYQPNAAVGDVMEPEAASLPARARLASVESRDPWSRHSSLPVVNRQRQLIGTLSRASMRWSRKREDGPPSGVGAFPGSQMIDAFAYSALELARLLTGADGPGTRRHGGEGGQ